MEAIKPLIVLVLFGTILYGAYSVVQKGSAAKSAGHADAPEAPAFAAPQVELTPPAAAPAATAMPAAPPEIVAAALPPIEQPGPPPVAAALPQPPVEPPPAVPAFPAPASDAPPVYLAAESAPPPAQADVIAPPPAGDDRPDRFATLDAAVPAAASLPPEMPPPPGALPSSAAFASAWADAHGKLAASRYAEALTALSVWYDDPSLGLEESHRLEDLLGQLAGTVIYSQEDLLLPPYVVAAGETLPAIAAPLGVSWQLLAKINGVADPMQLVPGEHLKLIRGPFDAVVSVSRRRLSIQVGGAYAGSFPVVVGRQFLPRVGSSLQVAEIRRAAAATDRSGVILSDGLMIEAADDPALVPDDAAPASLILSARDLAELTDILGPGSSVLVRQ